jgi:hypothetical protein
VVAYAPLPAAPSAASPGSGAGLARGARVLITGGTGGLGLLVARWLAGGGGGVRVAELCLVSRSGRVATAAAGGSSTDEAQDAFAWAAQCGVSVRVVVRVFGGVFGIGCSLQRSAPPGCPEFEALGFTRLRP